MAQATFSVRMDENLKRHEGYLFQFRRLMRLKELME